MKIHSCEQSHAASIPVIRLFLDMENNKQCKEFDFSSSNEES